MTVHSEPLKDGQRVTQPPRVGAENIALAAALLFFGGLAWVAGGKFTVEGWADWLSRIGAWLGVEGALEAPRGWVLIGLTLAVGLVYSFVELRVRSSAARHSPLFWLAWLPLVATDVGSTYVGLRATPDTAPLIIQQIAASWVLSALVTAVLTFTPEYMVIGALRLLRRLL
jgi:hypothetical protein